MVKFLGWQFTERDIKRIAGDRDKVERFLKHGYQVTKKVGCNTVVLTKPAKLVVAFTENKKTFVFNMIDDACKLYDKAEIDRYTAEDFVKGIRSGKIKVHFSPGNKAYSLIKWAKLWRQQKHHKIGASTFLFKILDKWREI